MMLSSPIHLHCNVCDSGFIRWRKRGSMETCTPCQRKARVKAWKIKYPERKRELNQKWANLNKDVDRLTKTAWSKRNWGYEIAKAAKYRAKKYSASPLWANNKAIIKIYDECPKGFHVDHIIPLQGKNVTGLHVENNLQYLPAFDNRSKSNNFEGNP